MGPQETLVLAISVVGAMGFIPHGSIGEKEPMLTEALLREVVERMGKEFNDAASGYLEFPQSERHLALMARASKDLENEQLDYDSLINGDPSPSLRDQEYLQHSSLWGHQYVTGGAGEGQQRLQPSGIVPNRQMVKTDAVLPAYCNPPNPCPVGYTEDQGCLIEFENTAAFSREYQLSQRCMCDAEHMFGCPEPQPDMELRFPEHKSLVAKKYKPDPMLVILFMKLSGSMLVCLVFGLRCMYDAEHMFGCPEPQPDMELRFPEHKSLVSKEYKPDVENPYLMGERLPIAAKKGFDVNSY